MRSTAKNFRLFLIRLWQPLLLYVLAISGIVSFLFLKLGSLVPGLSKTENIFTNGDNSLKALAHNPIYAPSKLGLYILEKLNLTSTFALRSISAIFGLLTVWLFFYLLRQWHTTRMAVLGTLLFSSSALFLHNARLATPSIIFLVALLLLLTFGLWVRKTKKSFLVVMAGTVFFLGTLYIPGLVWFSLTGAFWERKLLRKHVKHAPATAGLMAAGIVIVMSAPLAWGIWHTPSLARLVVGLPQHSLPSVIDFASNVMNVPLNFVLRGPNDPVLWLGRMPFLDIFTLAMVILGVYVWYSKRKLDRFKLYIGYFLLGLVLCGLGVVSNVIFLPLVYIFATSGMTLMLQQWFTVFPRNPLARAIGTSVLTVAILTTSYYHINRYFIAWPNAPQTKQVFQDKNFK